MATVDCLTASLNQSNARGAVREIVVAFELVAEDAAPWHLTANRQELLMNQIDIVDSACSSANTAFEQWAERNASEYRMFIS